MVSEFATGRFGLVYKMPLKVIIVGDRFGGWESQRNVCSTSFSGFLCSLSFPSLGGEKRDSGKWVALSGVFAPRSLFRFASESASFIILLTFHQHSSLGNSSWKTRHNRLIYTTNLHVFVKNILSSKWIQTLAAYKYLTIRTRLISTYICSLDWLLFKTSVFYIFYKPTRIFNFIHVTYVYIFH